MNALPKPAGATTALPTRLWAARAVLWAEALSAGLWPAASLLAALAALALFGLPSYLAWPVHALALFAALAALTVLLLPARRILSPPGLPLAERRLERDSGLRHRPFATLRDAPAGMGHDPDLWARHQAAARGALSRVTLRGPRPGLAARDPRALRAAAILLLAAGFVVAGPRAASRLSAALLPGWPVPSVPGQAVAVQAWIQPPAYTGLSPLFLPPGGSPADAPVTVPSGSRLTVSLTGLSDAPRLSLAGRAIGVERLGPDSFQSSTVLTGGGRLRASGGPLSALAGWTLAVTPNEPPMVAWTAPPGRAGTSLSTKLPWRVAQRWGVAQLQAELRPQGRPELPPLRLKLPLPGTPREATGSATPDLSADPYAGLLMTGKLLAQDVSGQQGEGAPAEFVLPAREFHHPLARAIADLRRRLALRPGARGEIADELSALAEARLEKPVAGLPESGVALNLAAAAARLAAPAARLDEAALLAEVQGRLWALALALDGALPDAAARALAEAKEDLRRGIEDHAHGKLSDKDLAAKLDALRQALDKRLADLAQRAMKQGALQKFDPHAQHLSAPAMERLIRQLEQALRDGDTESARQRMAELQRLIDQLGNAHIMTPEEAQAQREQAKRGRQQMGAVQDLVQREGGLLDHAQQRGGGTPDDASPPPPPVGLPPLGLPGLADQFAPPPQNPDDVAPPDVLPTPQPPASGSPGAKPQSAHPAPSPRDDARTQRAMRRALDALKDGLAEAGRRKPPSLDDADRAMGDAATALAAGQDPQARDAIARAIAALQQGGQAMSREQGGQSGAGMQLSLEPGGQPGGGEEGEDEPGDGKRGGKTDPFGRPVDGSGTVADDPNLRVPDEMERGRSRAIQEELRRRGADQARPKGELDYIGRLLKPF